MPGKVGPVSLECTASEGRGGRDQAAAVGCPASRKNSLHSPMNALTQEQGDPSNLASIIGVIPSLRQLPASAGREAQAGGVPLSRSDR